MVRRKSDGKPIEQYEHKDKERINNPPVGLVTPETDRDSGKKAYLDDPHLDRQLIRSGKAEHTSFEVPTVSRVVEIARRRHDLSHRVQLDRLRTPVDQGAARRGALALV